MQDDTHLAIRSGRDFGLAVRARREQLGLTQAELIDIAGLNDVPTLSRIESGKSVQHLDRVLTLLRRMGAEIEVVLPEASPSR